MKVKNKFKAQASMILIIFVIFIILGIGTFLLSFTRTISQSEYLNLYSHNLLLSILRTDTGYEDVNCKLVADVIACRFFTPSRTCGEGPTCGKLANDTINRYMNSFELISQNFRYLIIVKKAPELGVAIPSEPPIYIGDEDLETERITKFTANERIQKVLSRRGCDLDFSDYRACQIDITFLPNCNDILNDERDAYNQCISSEGRHILKAQLILARQK